jgi:hypothetical protein
MPGSFITMTICKTIYPKSMHLVCTIFAGICISISKDMKNENSQFPRNWSYSFIYERIKRRRIML